MDFRDLSPVKDPKGGSPKTPLGIPVREFPRTDYSEYPIFTNGNGYGLWRAISTGLGGLVIGLLVAWFTAIQSKGVSQSQVEDYVDKHSPYLLDKAVISEHNSAQDRQIGILEGKLERLQERLGKMDEKHVGYESDINDLKNKIKLLTDYIEAEKYPRK